MGKFSLVTTLSLNAAGYNSGLTKAKASTKQFATGIEGMQKSAKQAFGSLTGLISPQLGALGGFSDAIIGVGKSFKTASGGITTFKTALITSGVGAIIVGIGVAISGLITWFKKSEEGQIAFIKVMNSVSAVIEPFISLLADVGKAVFEAFTNPKKALLDLWNFIKSQFINRITGLFDVLRSLGELTVATFNQVKERLKNVFTDNADGVAKANQEMVESTKNMGKALLKVTTGFDKVPEPFRKLSNQIKSNVNELGDLNAAEAKLVEFKRVTGLENKKLESEVAELKLKAEDSINNKLEDRQKYIQEAIAKQKQIAANKKEELDLETTIANFKANQGLNDIKTNDELNDLKVKQFEITKEQNDKLKEMMGVQRGITKEVVKQVEAQTLQAKVTDAISKGVEIKVDKVDLSDFKIDDKEFKVEPKLDIPKIKGQLDYWQDEINVLKQAQEQSMSAEAYQAYQVQIDGINQKVAAFKGELDGLYTYEDVINSLSGSFDTLANSIGGSAGSFFSFASSLAELIPHLITQITALTTAQVSGAASVTTAKQSEAFASGVAASQAVPFPLNLIALAATTAALIKTFASMPKFENGGTLTGLPTNGDNTLALVKSDEMMLNSHQQSKLFNMINNGSSVGGEVVFEIAGDKLVGVLNNRNRRLNNFR